MAAILRVKRKQTDNPLDSLVIACKRQKTEASYSDTPIVQTVAQFAGTLSNPTEDEITKHIAKVLPQISTETHKAGVKRVSDNEYPATVSGKIPKLIDVNLATEKYKLNDQNSLDELNEESTDKWMTLIDVNDCWSNSHETNSTPGEDIEDYVYDLYYAQTSDNLWFENHNTYMVRRPEACTVVDSEDDDDSSDSNAESNWRNDYPDTDPDRSSREDDSEDNFEILDDDDIYSSSRKNKYGFVYRTERKYDSNSESNSSDDESDISDNEERSSDNEEN
ncbi:hypothetical protein PUN28_006012 [Cardiocondyla obscurior]|uniref:Probable RNA polymerase II nuclear localization protein SLC7A6OS n=2 Tax=Cardiocondyla obscurior TaxID=286306 RepID=A0AAW2GBM3_9HYME